MGGQVSAPGDLLYSGAHWGLALVGAAVGQQGQRREGRAGWTGRRGRMGWNPGASISVHPHVQLLRALERCGLQTWYESRLQPLLTQNSGGSGKHSSQLNQTDTARPGHPRDTVQIRVPRAPLAPSPTATPPHQPQSLFLMDFFYSIDLGGFVFDFLAVACGILVP